MPSDTSPPLNTNDAFDSTRFWVFAYGSLIWDMPFPVATTLRATLFNYDRSFCMDSVIFRGTKEKPGLVLALKFGDGAICEGLAYQIPPANAKSVFEALRARELYQSAYVERFVEVTLADGAKTYALTFVADPDHSYFRDWDPQKQARVIATSRGERGSNAEYLFKTIERMRAHGVIDPNLDCLASRVRRLGVDPES